MTTFALSQSSDIWLGTGFFPMDFPTLTGSKALSKENTRIEYEQRSVGCTWLSGISPDE